MIVRRARASRLEKLLRAGRLECQRKLDLRRERSRRIRDVRRFLPEPASLALSEQRNDDEADKRSQHDG